MNRLKKRLSPILLILAAMIWGFAFSAQEAAANVGALTLGAARSAFATVFLVFAVMIFDKLGKSGRKLFSKKKIIDLNRHEIIGGAICGSVLALASFFQQQGMNSGTSAGKASFITALYVVLVPVYAIFIKRRAPLNVWLSMPIAVFGFYFLCITEAFTISGSDIFVLICAFIFPVHILVIDRFSEKCDGVRMSLVQFFTATLINLFFALIIESPAAFAELKYSVLPVIFLGIGSSGIAYTLQIIGQRGVNPAAASILLSLESVFGVLGSVIFLGGKMTQRELIGSLAIFIAVILSELDFKAIFKRGKNLE